MSSEQDDKTLRLFDRRVVERNIKKGLTSRKDYDKHLKALSDSAENVSRPEERLEDPAADSND